MYSLHLWLCIAFCFAQATIGQGTEHWFHYRSYLVDTSFSGNYFAARDFCKGKRMDLVTLESKEIDETVFAELKKIVGTKETSFWTAGNRLGDDVTWMWTTTGQKITEFNWGTGEPNNGQGQQKCLQLYLNYPGYKSGYWDDKNCDFKNGAICQSHN